MCLRLPGESVAETCKNKPCPAQLRPYPFLSPHLCLAAAAPWPARARAPGIAAPAPASRPPPHPPSPPLSLRTNVCSCKEEK